MHADRQRPERPAPPRRRLTATVNIGADSTADLAVHLHQLATELATEHGVPEAVDRYTITEGAGSHLCVHVDPDISADSYLQALRAWARATLETHPRDDHRRCDGCGHLWTAHAEPFGCMVGTDDSDDRPVCTCARPGPEPF